MDKKTFEFHGTPGGYFVVFLVTLVCTYIPIFGWPVAFNYANEWIAKNLTIDGRKVKYQAGYLETLKFILINVLLIIITFGIYIFWYLPKQYRYILAHASYDDGAPAVTTKPTPATDKPESPAGDAPKPSAPPADKPKLVQ